MLNHRASMECPHADREQSARSALSYLCVCGRKWHGTGPNSPKNGAHRWTCSCGAALTLRNGVIYAPTLQEGVFPFSTDRLKQLGR